MSGEDDLPGVQRLLGEMLEHRTAEGRLLAFATFIRQPDVAWSTLACDHYAITEVLVRFGRVDDPRVRTALDLMADDITSTSLGQGCRCLPHSGTGGRGPGRVGDPCPQVTAEARRTFGRLEAADRPSALAEAARTLLQVWHKRAEVKPYMFGHGMHFKAVKWPNIWYSDLTVLEALAPYPEVWSGAGAECDGLQHLSRRPRRAPIDLPRFRSVLVRPGEEALTDRDGVGVRGLVLLQRAD